MPRAIGVLGAAVTIAASLIACPPAHTPHEPDLREQSADSATATAQATAPPATPSTPPAAPARPPLETTSTTPRGAPKLRVRRLPSPSPSSPSPDAGASSCSVAEALARLGPTCKRVSVATHEGTGPTTDASAAFDGDLCTTWNAGAPAPQSIRADVDAAQSGINGVLLVPEMTPDGNAVHVIEITSPPTSTPPAVTYVAEARYVSQGLHFVVFDRPHLAKTITIHTTSSPSWVAWRDVVPFACSGSGGAITVPADAVEDSPITKPPTPSYVDRRVRGTGACRTDDDCVPADCCHPRTCTAKRSAPRCDGVGCAQNVVPGTIGHGARCACVANRCGAVVREVEQKLL